MPKGIAQHQRRVAGVECSPKSYDFKDFGPKVLASSTSRGHRVECRVGVRPDNLAARKLRRPGRMSPDCGTRGGLTAASTSRLLGSIVHGITVAPSAAFPVRYLDSNVVVRAAPVSRDPLPAWTF